MCLLDAYVRLYIFPLLIVFSLECHQMVVACSWKYIVLVKYKIIEVSPFGMTPRH